MKLQSAFKSLTLLATALLTVSCASKQADEAFSPVVIGYGEGLFQIGELLHEDDFENLDNWVVQIQQTDADSEPVVETANGSLDILMPGRGATIWNREKFSGPVVIVYKVTAPTTNESEGIVVRDINSFWYASDPETPEELFNDQKYTGAFDSYHKQQGYYASTGGRDNTTTRLRRYPREADGEQIEHISLSARDGLDEFLIRPDQTHTIQLVAYDDVIQYIVDEKVVYEIREGDTITITRPDGENEEVEYTTDRFPPYSEGWFGFRMVNTQHIYSDFKVYRLIPANENG